VAEMLVIVAREEDVGDSREGDVGDSREGDVGDSREGEVGDLTSMGILVSKVIHFTRERYLAVLLH